MSSELAIRVQNLSKCYQIYDSPRDRLKQFVVPRIKRAINPLKQFVTRHPLPVTDYYREFWALRAVSFEVKRGETVGIIGRNGSGKSTLLQMVCETVSPTTGTVITNGRVAALLELGAGFNSEFTGLENVLLNAAILGLPQEIMTGKMSEVLAFSELGEFLYQPVKTYSSGMYARLAFSIAIHVDPEILIVDEALAVGDVRFVAKCMRRIKEFQDRGTTILFVSHDVSAVRTLCDRAIWLDKGTIIDDGDVFPVTGKYMEFMFKDEVSEEQLLLQEIVANQEDLKEAGKLQVIGPDEKHTNASSDQAEQCLDDRPVTHWGSRKGLILGASVCDGKGVRRNVFAWGQPIEVVINVCVSRDIPREHLSVAFSIKDLKGTDLIVSTTHDRGAVAIPDRARFNIRFRMINPLVTGKYLLVVAVENRADRDIHYYEYLEGAHYFSSLAEQRFFGIFQPAIDQSVEVL